MNADIDTTPSLKITLTTTKCRPCEVRHDN